MKRKTPKIKINTFLKKRDVGCRCNEKLILLCLSISSFIFCFTHIV